MMLKGDAYISPNLDILTSIQFLKSLNVKPIGSDGDFYIGLLSWTVNDNITNWQNPNDTRRRLISDSGELDSPLFNLIHNKNRDLSTPTIRRFDLNYKPTSWLKFTDHFNTEFYSTLGNFFVNPESNLGIGRRGEIDNYLENDQFITSKFIGSVNTQSGRFKFSTQVEGIFMTADTK